MVSKPKEFTISKKPGKFKDFFMSKLGHLKLQILAGIKSCNFDHLIQSWKLLKNFSIYPGGSNCCFIRIKAENFN